MTGIEKVTNIDTQVFEDVGHTLFALAVADASETYDLDAIPQGGRLEAMVDRYKDQGYIREVMAHIVGQLEHAWNWRLFWVDARMSDNPDFDLTDFLFAVCMACMGHGVHPFDTAGIRETWNKNFPGRNPTPLHFDNPFGDIALEYLVEYEYAQLTDQEPWVVRAD